MSFPGEAIQADLQQLRNKKINAHVRRQTITHINIHTYIQELRSFKLISNICAPKKRLIFTCVTEAFAYIHIYIHVHKAFICVDMYAYTQTHTLHFSPGSSSGAGGLRGLSVCVHICMYVCMHVYMYV